jgi:heme-degrading monooxygenase HmoA
MYTRVARITWPQGEKVEGMDEAMQAVRDQIMPFAQRLHGFKGFFGLSRDGEIVLVSLWETEADLQASESGGYVEHIKNALAFLPQVQKTPLWLQSYEVFTSEFPCT